MFYARKMIFTLLLGAALIPAKAGFAESLDDIADVVGKLMSGKTLVGDNGTRQTFDKLTKDGDSYWFRNIRVTTISGVSVTAVDQIFQSPDNSGFIVSELCENETTDYKIELILGGRGFRVSDITDAGQGFLKRECWSDSNKTLCDVTSTGGSPGTYSVVHFVSE